MEAKARSTNNMTPNAQELTSPLGCGPHLQAPVTRPRRGRRDGDRAERTMTSSSTPLAHGPRCATRVSNQILRRPITVPELITWHGPVAGALAATRLEILVHNPDELFATLRRLLN